MRNPGARLASETAITALARQWDEIASTRHEQIVSGRDISYSRILCPTILDLLAGVSGSVVDVGSGTGDLSALLAGQFGKVVAVDISQESVEIARDTYGHLRNLSFEVATVEAYATETTDIPFDAVVANMTLITTPDLDSTVAAIARLLRHGGTFIATVAHPAFWPRYWGYEDAEWFRYHAELAISAPFQISGEGVAARTTHFHRPLERYAIALGSAGLSIVNIREPMPDQATRQLYPERWGYPRFLCFECSRLQVGDNESS